MNQQINPLYRSILENPFDRESLGELDVKFIIHDHHNFNFKKVNPKDKSKVIRVTEFRLDNQLAVIENEIISCISRQLITSLLIELISYRKLIQEHNTDVCQIIEIVKED